MIGAGIDGGLSEDVAGTGLLKWHRLPAWEGTFERYVPGFNQVQPLYRGAEAKEGLALCQAASWRVVEEGSEIGLHHMIVIICVGLRKWEALGKGVWV